MVRSVLRGNGHNLFVMAIIASPGQPLNFVSGEVLAVDKPLGWTSFDAVKRLRGAIQRRLGVKKFKVGHAGTLDPLADGVLIVCTGKATRSIDELQSGEKEYVARIMLGATTPSFDLETEIDEHFPTDHITRESVEEILPQFTGKIMQVPPVFSAVKVDGKRAYKYARKGAEVELKAKPLEIREIELISCNLPEITIRVVCSKGTYIRALARDIGTALGSGAHLIGLRRIRVGKIPIERCLKLDDALDMIKSAPLEFPEGYSCPAMATERRNSNDSNVKA